MKRRIEQLLNGIFEYEPAKLLIEPQQLTVTAAPGAIVRGSFVIESEDGKKARGFLYAENPRILCEPVEFQGVRSEIRYQVDCSGLEAGEEQGVITVCSDRGEYEIPYCLRMQEQEKPEAVFAFENLEEFAQLAQRDLARAHRDFVSPAFAGFAQSCGVSVQSLYEAVGARRAEPSGLEAFLAGAHCKDALEFSLERDQYRWEELTEPVRETIRIYRNTWGWGRITVESDAGFLRPEKRQISTDEFAGSSFDLNVVLDANLMHAGYNCARLTLRAGCQTLTAEIHAHRGGRAGTARQRRTCHIMQKELEALYVSFRLKKTDIATWVERSVSVINSYRRAGGDDPFAELFLVQLYFADGKKQKAFHILEALEKQKARLNTPERYGFYLYMTTFFYQEASYVDRVEEEISRLYVRNRSSWKLLWILLYLQERFLKDENARYEAIGEQFTAGCRSRILYLEAYQILKKNPFLLRHLGDYEVHLLRFAAREKILTAEIVRQAAGLAAHQGAFSLPLYEVLETGYELYPSIDLVKSICRLLMKGEQKDPRYFPWFEKGVEAGLRITGLYEYYMETMENLDIRKMPQVIRMYFAYDSALDYRRRAAVYRNIVENRGEDMQTYRNFRVNMEKFTLEQLEGGRISDDLAVLYGTFLKRSLLTKPMAEKLTKILFTYEVACSEPGVRQAVVRSARQRQEQKAPFADGRAYIQIYDPAAAVLLEDENGVRSPAEGRCTVRRVLEHREMLDWCAQLAPEHPGLLLYLCAQCLEAGLLNRSSLPYFRTACAGSWFADEFRDRMRRAVLHYYVEHLRDESLPEFLESIPYLEYVKVDKAALITLLAEEGKCMDAFALLDAYGIEGIALLQLVRICSRMVLELEFEENAMLVALCHYCFESGKYDDKLLRYLLLYYEGSVRSMKLVWQAAVRFDLDTMLLEEKILMMILFTHSGTQGTEPVFESYLGKIGRKRLCKAYVNLKSYEYFVKGMPVADSVFQYIEREYEHLARRDRLDEQEEVCRLALLQYYARAAQLTPEQRKRTAEFLEEFAARGLRFAFWQQFDRELLAPYQMEGRVFVEYVCSPEHIVNIYYRLRGRGEEYRKEPMKNYFEGVFVREFTLFSGEELECYLEEEQGRTVKKTDPRVLRAGETEDGMSRYAMLNRLLRAQQERSGKFGEELTAYLTLEYLAGEVFTLV